MQELEGGEPGQAVPGVHRRRDAGAAVGHHRHGSAGGNPPSFSWRDSGQLFTWLYPLHCLLLTGEDKDYYYFNDPLVGKNVAYPKEQVEAAL